jgi:MoaA/NifB/PqqE/SkfB family radical SAM enzyme
MWTLDTIEWIDIELTSFCNISCKGCFRVISKWADKINNTTYLSLDTIKERFKKEDFPSIKIINFCGSVDEPTSHPEFFEIVKYFADWDCHMNIATNGSIRTEKWWTELASIVPKSHRVTWGIDGSNAVSEIYRQGSSFDKVQKNFRAFNKAGGQSTWQFIVFEHNQHQEEAAKQMAKDEGFKKFQTIISHRVDTKDVKHKHVGNSMNMVVIPEHKEEEQISCKYGNQKRIFVNHTGNVIPCCHLNSKMLEYPHRQEELDRFERDLKQYDYMNDINLENVTIEQAINGKIWTDIKKSWNEDDKIEKCWKTCKQRKHDIFIKEQL